MQDLDAAKAAQQGAGAEQAPEALAAVAALAGAVSAAAAAAAVEPAEQQASPSEVPGEEAGEREKQIMMVAAQERIEKVRQAMAAAREARQASGRGPRTHRPPRLLPAFRPAGQTWQTVHGGLRFAGRLPAALPGWLPGDAGCRVIAGLEVFCVMLGPRLLPGLRCIAAARSPAVFSFPGCSTLHS
jgi:hypothetical protein